MDRSNLKKAIEIDQEIADLKYFLLTLSADASKASKYHFFAQIKSKVTYSIFGYRFFGCGAHEKTIEVPRSLISDLYTLAEKRKEQLEKEYIVLWSTRNDI